MRDEITHRALGPLFIMYESLPPGGARPGQGEACRWADRPKGQRRCLVAGGTRELPAALDLAPTSHELPAEVGDASGQTGAERDERHQDGTPGLARRASPRAHLRIIRWPLSENCQLLLFSRHFPSKGVDLIRVEVSAARHSHLDQQTLM